eukprot:5190772-Prymnesium_polylepis.1
MLVAYALLLASHGALALRPLAYRPSRASARAAPRATVADDNGNEARALLLTMGRATAAAAPAKADALEALMRLPAAERDGVLDAALTVVDANAGSKLARWRLPVRLPSRRTTIGCFRRLLETMEAEEPGAGARFQDGGRRRRFLLVLLRQAKDGRGAWALEHEAAKRRAQDGSMEEMLRRTPDGLETPRYDVVAEKGAWEVRRYDEFSVVTTRTARPVSSGGKSCASISRRSACRLRYRGLASD